MLTEANVKKGDVIYDKSYDEYGVVNKVKGKVAYIKFQSTGAKSFDPVLVSDIKYKGKHKGKDLYVTEAICADQSHRYEKEESIAPDHDGKAAPYGSGYDKVTEDKDIGHQDDEPNMLKSTALEIMEYGKKLMDKLDKYDDMEEEVDFPNWWQSKLIISKEYLQKAYHYLDSEEKTEESINEAIILPAEKSLAKKLLKTKFTKKQNWSNYRYERGFVDNWREETGSKIYRVPEFKAQFGVYPNGKVAFKYVESDSTNKAERETIFYNKPEDITEGKLNESMIGIQTKANFKPNTLKGALERAGMKGFQMNRLSVTLTALKLDKKDFEKAKKIIDAMPTAKIMTAKESVNEMKIKKNSYRDYDELIISQDNTIQFKKEGNNYLVRYVTSNSYMDKDIMKFMPKMGQTSYAGRYSYKYDGSLNPAKLNKAKFEKLLSAVDKGWKRYAKSFADFYAKRQVADGKVNEATSLWKHFDAKMRLQDEIMDIEQDMKNITGTIKQLHKNMEQEAEPEGGKIADKYGRQIDKYEKMYKKRKAEFKKLMAKLDKMEQY